jgi:putative ABC transport system substrate-binding protein
MSRKISVWLLATILLITARPTAAQQAGKIYRVGRLSGGLSNSTFSLDALRRELRELGYIEGKNIAFELRSAEEKPERLPALADELVRLKVDVIVAGGPNDGLTAMKATKTIPIVFTEFLSDPVARGLVDSLARPGGNVTGFFTMSDVLAGKRLQVLKEAIPKLSRVAVLWYQSLRAASRSGQKASSWRDNSGCNFTPWGSAVRTTMRAPSRRLSKRVAPVWP